MRTVVFDYDGTLHETLRIYAPAFRENYAYMVSAGLLPAREITDGEIASWLGYTAGDMWREFAPGLTPEQALAAGRRVQEGMQRRIRDGTARLYPEVPEMMDRLKDEGYRLVFLSNCKTVYLEAHRKRFPLDRWFDAYYWAEAEDWRPKEDILRKIILESGEHARQDGLHEPEAGSPGLSAAAAVSPGLPGAVAGSTDYPGSEAGSPGLEEKNAAASFREAAAGFAVVGDRFHDMQAAAVNGIPAIGCAYGYGTPQEFRTAAYVARSPADIPDLLRKVFSRTGQP